MNGFKPVVARFVNNLVKDIVPQTPAELVDFGFNYAETKTAEIALFAAYRDGLLKGLIAPQELDAAVGNGSMLTRLVTRVNPDLKVVTDYDFFTCDDDEGDEEVT